MTTWTGDDETTAVVVDIGGTTLRIGRWDAVAGRVGDVARYAVEGLGLHPDDPPDRLQSRVLAQLGDRIAGYLDRCPRVDSIGVSFAGPVDEHGMVLAAPTIWGSGAGRLDLARILTRRLGRRVVVANDMTAAAWRYAAQEPEPFCVITISSGIGNKVFRNGEVLVHPLGFGGELGHWLVDPRPEALRCDCGGRGHLAAIASGRGLLAGARRAAFDRPEHFARSMLSGLVTAPDVITGPALAQALRMGDVFATEVLRGALRHLAAAISCLYVAIGVRRYIVIGGFAVAVGQPIIHHLANQLREVGCFGLGEDVACMVRLGEPDDDHGLIGMGRLVAGGLPAGRMAEAGSR
jgi:glucokinase